jgi:hypothetical protein
MAISEARVVTTTYYYDSEKYQKTICSGLLVPEGKAIGCWSCTGCFDTSSYFTELP